MRELQMNMQQQILFSEKHLEKATEYRSPEIRQTIVYSRSISWHKFSEK